MEETKEGSRLHTAEHIFARALQEQDLEIHVRKADTYREDNIGKAYIREIIPLEKIFKAEEVVNEKILENLKITEETFDDLKKAIDKNPKMRFNEERIDENNRVRVISIGDYDFSACKHQHVAETSEITCFAIKRVSYLGGETEVEFLSGINAIKFLLNEKNSILSSAIENHFLPEKIQDYIKNIKEGKENAEKDEKEMLYRLVESNVKIIKLIGVKLSKFYDEINSIIKEYPEKMIILENEEQLLVEKGSKNDYDLLSFGRKLEELGFKGIVNPTIINGRVNERVIKEVEKTFEYE